MEKKISAVEWLVLHLNKEEWFTHKQKQTIEQAKAMEKEQSHLYAEFAIRCDMKDMKILNFEDWIKLETFKSE